MGYSWHLFDQVGSVEDSRNIFSRAATHFKDIEPNLKEERLMILENWLEME